MIDVLAKPFTKENMSRILTKHLPPHVFKLPDPQNSAPMSPSGFVTPNHSQTSSVQLTMPPLAPPSSSVKEEPTSGKSPVTTTSWNPPAQMPGPSPIGVNSSFIQPMRDQPMYSMTPTLPQPPSAFPNTALATLTPALPNLAPGVPPIIGTPLPRVAVPPRRVAGELTGAEPVTSEHPEKRQRLFSGALAR